MGINVVDRKFYSLIKNNTTFLLKPLDFGTHLKGSVMEKLQAVYTINVSWGASASTTSEFTAVGSVGNNVITRVTGSFLNDNISIGDIVDVFEAGSSTPTYSSRTILSVSDLLLVFDGSSVTDGDFVEYEIKGINGLTGLIWKFGIIENSETSNYQSKVTGDLQAYSFKDMILSGGAVTGVALGTIKGWQSGSMKCRRNANIDTYTQQFEVEHTFIVLPYYTDGELNNLQNLIPPSLYVGNNSTKYIAEYEFRTVISNPNTSKTGRDNQLLGEVGWFNENYNGQTNNYYIDSISYSDTITGNSANGIVVGASTTVTARVKSNNPTVFNANDPVVISVSALPSSSTYLNSPNTFNDNFLLDHARNKINNAAISIGLFNNYSVTIISANEIEVIFEAQYTLAQQALIDASIYYLIGIQVANDSLTTDNSDKVTLIADVKNYVKSADIPDLMKTTKMEFYQHANDLGSTSFTSFDGWVEDGVMLDFEFSIDLALSAFLQAMNFKIIAYNPTTGAQFTIQDYVLNLNNQSIVSGSQQIVLDATRGYLLPSGDQFDFVKIITGAKVGTDQYYSGQIGFKINWQDWLSLPNADTIFYDNSLLNNGLNQNASRYSLINGYELRAVLEHKVSNGDTLTTYQSHSPSLNVKNYNEDDSGVLYAGVITLENQIGTDIGSSLLTDENTRIKCTWDKIAEPITDLSGYYGIIRIQEFEQNGFNISELSSVRAYDTPSNPLQPIIGETLVKLTIVGGDIVAECDLNYLLIDENKSYTISARLGSKNPIVPVIGKDTEAGAQKQLENAISKALE